MPHVAKHARMPSRRAILGWGVAGTLATLVDRAPRPELLNGYNLSTSGRIPLLRAASAERLAGSFGVVTHFHFLSSPYAQWERAVELVTELGVRHVRNKISASPNVRSAFARLAGSGVRIEGVCGAFGDPQSMAELLAEVVHGYDSPPLVFSAFEGINEPNNNGVPWVVETRAKTQALYEQRALYGLTMIPIVGPALARVSAGGVEGADTEQQSKSLGNLTRWIDRGNIHVYPRGRSPSTDLDAFIEWQRQVCGNEPIFDTEGGYFTASNYQGGGNASTEDCVRQYVPREVMENWIRGVERFFLYELLDEPDTTQSRRESNFGMVSVSGQGSVATWTPKPHFFAMKNFIQILADPGPPHTVQGLACRLSGGGQDLRFSLVQKRTGSHYLCVWRDVSIYDPVARVAQAVTPSTVEVTLGAPADVTEYKPSSQANPVAAYSAAMRFSLSVAGELHICEIASAA